MGSEIRCKLWAVRLGVRCGQQDRMQDVGAETQDRMQDVGAETVRMDARCGQQLTGRLIAKAAADAF
eukprot:1160271-Pelagomonas_calceolata.AAC.7